MRRLLRELLKSFKLASVALGFALALFFDTNALFYLVYRQWSNSAACFIVGGLIGMMAIDIIRTMRHEREEEENGCSEDCGDE